jgi:hypothetical protein
MAIKTNTVLPPGFKVTRCAPASKEVVAKVVPLYKLLQAEEAALAAGFSSLKDAQAAQASASEHNSERYFETYGACRADGLSVSDSLDAANGY